MLSMAMFLARLLLLASIFCFLAFAELPPDEVEALKQIAKTLAKNDWNFSVDPCSQQWGWSDLRTSADYKVANAVTCNNCTFVNNNTVCHVTTIVLKSQNLSGTVPPEIVRLPFLQEIDLSLNYLNGIIPPGWGSLKVVNISLYGNRVTGPMPKELGNISTLKSLVLEFNQLSGTIPPELGNLPSIERLCLTSNNLTGELPESLSNLTTLKDFRIGDNNFVGNIPNFIQKWTNMDKLVIQGSGLSGPIPSGIASLTKLTDLRISDLNGNDSAFPPLNDIKTLKILILRSCNIIGQLPSYIGTNTSLKVLDLSFNKLSGHIPGEFQGLSGMNYIYLTGNSLTGPVPTWMLDSRNSIDLSYNTLTFENPESNCQRQNLNLFASSKGNTSGVVSCLRNCEREYDSFHINCGGRDVGDDKRSTYEEDTDPGGPAYFFQSRTNWAFSSTGHFLNADNKSSQYILNISGQNSQLYMDARISPLSLTYYGFCLINGKYTIKLHFAEIMFPSDRTHASLGRRVFDIYIQGKPVLKDFNIEEEAGGVNKAIIRSFPAVVTDNTLDIRFYWAGKGTKTLIPYKGVYGPLISAISVDRDSKPGISTGAIVGIVLGILFTVLLVLGILWRKGCLRRKDSMEHDLKGLDLRTGLFSLRQVKAATNNFDPANKIGEGGFGPVYKGLLSDGTIIAVKQLSSKSKQGSREFVNEIGMISPLQHPHLVKLYGCCVEGNQLLVVYEYMENNSLARALFGKEENLLNLNWPTRRKISIGIARGLAYLHGESRLKIVHRDIKATNVLLDKNLNPKISDFGIAKLDEEDTTHISTRVAGTFGYMAPEYAMRGHLTDKADVYSFGVVVLEIVSGRSNTSIFKPKEDCPYLLDWANFLKENRNLMELVDPRMESKFDKEDVIKVINVALLCMNAVAAERPSMSAVVSMLEGKGGIGEFVSDSTVSINEMSPKETSVLFDANWTASSSSTSAVDLYPIALNTDYWEKRNQ